MDLPGVSEGLKLWLVIKPSIRIVEETPMFNIIINLEGNFNNDELKNE